LWPFSEGFDFPKQDAQAAAIGESGLSVAESGSDPTSPLVISLRTNCIERALNLIRSL
jgi:hypothetical protein